MRPTASRGQGPYRASRSAARTAHTDRPQGDAEASDEGVTRTRRVDHLNAKRWLLDHGIAEDGQGTPFAQRHHDHLIGRAA